MPISLIIFGAIILAIAIIAITLLIYKKTHPSAYQQEYNLDRPSGNTPKFGIRVFWPSWMSSSDHTSCLRMVDQYAQAMIDSYPKLKDFPWSDKWVYIHDEVGDKIVCAGWGWVWGWQSGRVVYTPWSPIKDASGNRVGVSEDRCLIVLPHEFVHMISAWEGCGEDSTHSTFFVRPEIVKLISDARSATTVCLLSAESKEKALAFKYVPWETPASK